MAGPSGNPVVVSALPAGVLAETLVTTWNDKHQPTGYIIVVSSDAAGRGWYVGSASSTASPFTQSKSTSIFEAAPGSAAYGHYDLLTTLLHELGHVEGLMSGDPAFERYIQSIAGAQVFEAPGVTALLVDQDQELDFGGYPGDLMSSTLAPSVRELPSHLDFTIVQAIDAPAPPPSTQRNSVPTTTVIDHALGALGTTPPPSTPVRSKKPVHHKPAKSKKTVERKLHPVTIKVKPDGANHIRREPTPRIVSNPQGKAPAKTKHTPDRSAAVELSRRGMIPERKS